MSQCTEWVKCPQCGFPQADSFFESHAETEIVTCRRCGYYAHAAPVRDGSGNDVGWKREITVGVGVVGGDHGYHTLHSEEQVTAAARSLRAGLVEGKYRDSTSYVTRWNRGPRWNEGQIEFLVGSEPRLREG